MAGRICRESQRARSGGTLFCQSFSQKPPFFGGFWGPKMRLCSGLPAGSLMRPRKRGRVVLTPGTMESANWMCLYMYGSLTRLFFHPPSVQKGLVLVHVRFANATFFIPRPFFHPPSVQYNEMEILQVPNPLTLVSSSDQNMDNFDSVYRMQNLCSKIWSRLLYVV